MVLLVHRLQKLWWRPSSGSVTSTRPSILWSTPTSTGTFGRRSKTPFCAPCPVASAAGRILPDTYSPVMGNLCTEMRDCRWVKWETMLLEKAQRVRTTEGVVQCTRGETTPLTFPRVDVLERRSCGRSLYQRVVIVHIRMVGVEKRPRKMQTNLWWMKRKSWTKHYLVLWMIIINTSIKSTSKPDKSPKICRLNIFLRLRLEFLLKVFKWE